MITTTQTKSISRNARRKQKSKSLDVSIQELYEMYKVADVKLSAQRYKESISKNSIITFAYRVIDGLIHQNLTLANIKQCFSNTRDPRWIEKLGSNKPILNFLILDDIFSSVSSIKTSFKLSLSYAVVPFVRPSFDALAKPSISPSDIRS